MKEGNNVRQNKHRKSHLDNRISKTHWIHLYIQPPFSLSPGRCWNDQSISNADAFAKIRNTGKVKCWGTLTEWVAHSVCNGERTGLRDSTQAVTVYRTISKSFMHS